MLYTNHIFEPFSVRRACTQCYITSEPYPRPSQIWYQNVRETRKKIVIKCRGESFARCRVIARYVEGGAIMAPPSLIRVKTPFSRLASRSKAYLFHCQTFQHIFFIDQPVPMPTQLKSQFSRPPFHVKSQFPRPPFGEGRLVLKPLGSNKQPFLRVWFQILGPHTPTLSKC